MWAPRHPCHGWKSGECEIFQLGNYSWAKLPQIVPKEFDAAMSSQPKLLVCSVEFLADSQVGGVDDPICQLFNFSQVRNVLWVTMSTLLLSILRQKRLG
mgnify:CR=1 FL=1